MKKEIRKQNKAKRLAMNSAEILEKSRMAQENFLKTKMYAKAGQIMLYKPIYNETDTALIMDKAFCDGKIVLLPVTDPKSCEITPVIAKRNSEFVRGGFSVFEPKIKEIADIGGTDLVLVPGIAFDRSGARIGFGKGCYDKLLCKENIIKVGFCYDFQICEKIDENEHDVKMDYIITESAIIKCK